MREVLAGGLDAGQERAADRAHARHHQPDRAVCRRSLAHAAEGLQLTCRCQSREDGVKRAPIRQVGKESFVAATSTEKKKTKAPVAKGTGKTCKVEGCKRAYQAKGYCFFHYGKWKAGELPKARFDTCGKEGCKKKVVAHGRCAEHQKVKAEPAAGAAPAAPAA
ncbi:MAG: hypothetical protein NVSMB23_03490 [Myxococcales bacterium]